MIRTTALSLALLLLAGTVSGQEAVWAPAFRGTALRRLEAAAVNTTTYTGRGDLAGGVTAIRNAAPEAEAEVDEAAVEEEAAAEAEARAGTGAQSPKGYSLVEDQPRCNFTLGSGYCAQPGEPSRRLLHCGGSSSTDDGGQSSRWV